MKANLANRILIAALIAAGLSSSSHAASPSIWNGAGDGNWSNAANWTASNVPVPGSAYDLQFAGANVANTNNFTAASNFRNITFNSGAGSFILGGNPITLNGNITNSSTNLQTISLNLATTAARTFTTSTGGGDITVSGIVSGTAGAITKAGPGTLILSGANTYTGATLATAGNLQISGTSGSSSAASAYTLGIGGTLLLDNTTAAGGNNNSRIFDTSTIALSGGSLVYKGSDTGDSAETVGAISEYSSSGSITLTYGGTSAVTLTAASLTHAVGSAVALVNGVSLGKDTASTTSVSRLILTASPTLTGTTVDAGNGIDGASQNTKIVPFLVGEATQSSGGLGTATGTPNTLLTYNSGSGLRPLNPTDEFTHNLITTGHNTYINGATNVPVTAAVNSLVINGADLSIDDGQTLTDTSGALLFASSHAIKPSDTTGALTFANNVEGQIYVNAGVTGTISAAITATGTNVLTKSGPGTLVLSGANTYSGNTQVGSGTLQTNGTNSSAGATTILPGATLSVGTGANGGLASGNLNGCSGSFNTTGLSTANITAGVLSNTTGSTVTLSNPISLNQNLGNTSLVIAGNSALNLTGGLSHSNTSSFNGITSNSSALVTFSGANFNLTKSGDANNRNFSIAGTGSVTINSVVANPNGPSFSGSLFYNGNGTLTLGNANSYNGATAFGGSNGTIRITDAGGLSSGPITYNVSTTNSTLILAAGVTTTTANSLSWNQNGASTSTITLDAPSPQAGYTQTFGVTNFGQQVAITFNQTGNLTSAGTIAFGAATFGSNNSTAKSTTLNPIGVNLSLGTITAQAFTATTVTGTNFLILDGTSTGNQISGAIADTTNGFGTDKAGVTKSNSSTWTLGGANTYTGATFVKGGTLVLSGSTASGSAVTVGGATANGTPTLSGGGTVNGSLTVAAAGGGAAGTVNPGSVGGIGTLAAVGNTTIAGTYACDINAASSDQLAVSGTLTLTSATLTFNALATPLAASYTIATYTGAAPSFTTVSNLPAGYALDYATAGVIKLVGTAPTYNTWIGGYSVGLLTGPNDDFDNDGLDNAVEHVLGSDPSVSNIGLTQVSSTAASFKFRHNQTNSLATDVTKSYQWSTNLVDWKASGETNTGGTTATIAEATITDNAAPANDVIEVTVTVTGGPATKVFGRLVATKAP